MAIENDRPLRKGDKIILMATVSFDHEGDGRRVHLHVHSSGENLWIPREACDLGPEVIEVGDKVQIGPHHAAEVLGVTDREVWVRLPSGLTSVKQRYEVFRWYEPVAEEPLQIEDPAVAEPAVEVAPLDYGHRLHPDYEIGSQDVPVARKVPRTPEDEELVSKLTAPREFSQPEDPYKRIFGVGDSTSPLHGEKPATASHYVIPDRNPENSDDFDF